MQNKVSVPVKLGRALKMKCPNCGKGDVYHKGKIPFFNAPPMYDACPECNYKFNREPGYYFGAAYASYALSVAEGIAAFVISWLLSPDLSALSLAFIVTGTVLFFSLWNFKLSRILWLIIFP
ncbi:MAG: DUF983 domain-containing protein [Bacteroidetes bacterium]|nr:DUF983 domain-containing protein [Bacteroidota bacterium]